MIARLVVWWPGWWIVPIEVVVAVILGFVMWRGSRH